MDSLNEHLCLEELVTACGSNPSVSRRDVMTMHHLADPSPPNPGSGVGDTGSLPPSHHHSHSGSVAASSHSSHVSHPSHSNHSSSHSNHSSHSSQQRSSLASSGPSADPSSADRSTGRMMLKSRGSYLSLNPVCLS